MGTTDDNDGEILLRGSARSATQMVELHGPRAGGPGRCKPPRFSRHGLASDWWGAVSKYLLLYLTCSQRNHGDAQQQAACAALHARAQTVPPSYDVDPEHEALWGH